VAHSHRHQVLRRRRRGRAVPFALAVIVLTIPPARMGSEDLRVPAVFPAPGGSFRAHFIASPFGTIHAATFRFSQPVGTETPAGSGLRSGLHLAAYTAAGDAAPPPPFVTGEGREGVEIDRSRKGPRLVPDVRPDRGGPPPVNRDGATLPPQSAAPPATATAGPDDRAPAARDEAGDANLVDPGHDARETAEPSTRQPPSTTQQLSSGQPWPIDGDGATIRMARIYFVTTSLGRPPAAVTPWPAEAPVIGLQDFDGEPEAVTAALEVTAQEPPGNQPPDNLPPDNQTIAPKGEVTGEDRRPKSPAELLDLTGAARAKHEKCLADAIYFEARGEPVRGQMAVAQVVINRVFSGYYPSNVCGVVYQSTRRHRRLRCQFSFTCDGIPDRVTEPDAWERATHIARDALDGNFWLNDIGKATHYHARWVYPRWVHEMRRLDRIGVHTFYRPRRWGDGASSPVWGDPTAKL
jgi:spore germination cell wall hydrolase CwlJ-like protein